MKFIRVIILSIPFLLLQPLTAEVEKDHSLSVNPIIKNEQLKSKLESLKQDFDVERQKIQDYYTKEIERLKEERRLEVKALKKKFVGQRETLMQKYSEDRNLKLSKSEKGSQPDKKLIRKSK